ncbi:unnamed protein product [Ceutorhynchus assimilis]|uniref:RNA helicase n=1 Tax=Ceutorhynchus assimilis TaxID=467358 RepID=A0A9P0DP93_9CUCU|nr:unnamed protein product [Ceutorhynchus assimilis]
MSDDDWDDGMTPPKNVGAKATSQIQEAKNFDENDDEVLRSFAPGPRSFSTSRLVGRGRGRSNSNQNNGFANENGNDKGGWKREEGRWEQHTGEVLESNGYEGRGRGRGRGSGRGRGGGRSYSDNEDNDFDGRENRSRDRGRGRGRGGSRGGREGSTMRHNDDDKKVGEDGQPEKPREIYVPVERVADDELFTTTITSGVNFMKLDDIKVNVSGDDVPKPVNSFAASGLRPHLLENIKKSKYMKPTPIQKYAIPIILAGRDLMGCAQTGSGKTAAFLLPMIHKILEKQDPPAREGNTAMPNVVIVSPTRELTIQIYEQAKKFSFNSVVKTVVVYGGTAIHHQRNQVNAGCHILVGTPGRLIDFLQRGHISFSAIDFFVLDEADRMLDMGFLPAIEQMLSHQTMRATGERQTLMFSATFPEEIQHLAGKFLHNYAFISVGIVGSASSDVEQNFFQVTKFDKRKKLLEMLKDCKELTMVFVETKRNADFLATLLSENEISSTSIHGDRLQSQREEALWEFKKGIRKILVATGVASRGLDIEGIQHVINYDLPKSVDEYVHRIGRTGRVGNRGKATSFYDASQDRPLAGELANILKQAGQNVPNFLSGSGGGYADDGDDGNFGGRDIRGEDYGRGQNFNKQPAEAGDEEW